LYITRVSRSAPPASRGLDPILFFPETGDAWKSPPLWLAIPRHKISQIYQRVNKPLARNDFSCKYRDTVLQRNENM
jgi:hypothetical protein